MSVTQDRTTTPALDALSALARAEIGAGSTGLVGEAAVAHEWQQGFLAGLDCAFSVPGTVLLLRRAVWREWLQFSADLTERDLAREAQRVANALIGVVERRR